MHTKIITGLIISTALFSTVRAMEMATGSDSMMKDKMMDDGKMMKKDESMMKDKMVH